MKPTKEHLKDIFLMGEIQEQDGNLYWYYETDITDDTASDDLWDTFCEDMNSIRTIYPNFEYIESWQDNDSTGCKIIKI